MSNSTSISDHVESTCKDKLIEVINGLLKLQTNSLIGRYDLKNALLRLNSPLIIGEGTVDNDYRSRNAEVMNVLRRFIQVNSMSYSQRCSCNRVEGGDAPFKCKSRESCIACLHTRQLLQNLILQLNQFSKECNSNGSSISDKLLSNDTVKQIILGDSLANCFNFTGVKIEVFSNPGMINNTISFIQTVNNTANVRAVLILLSLNTIDQECDIPTNLSKLLWTIITRIPKAITIVCVPSKETATNLISSKIHTIVNLIANAFIAKGEDRVTLLRYDFDDELKCIAEDDVDYIVKLMRNMDDSLINAPQSKPPDFDSVGEVCLPNFLGSIENK
ncbi:hypothetical protein GJ496_009399 [Pomphorhynchus laevis]|nr:hypothetical protein GJ496_009399 [Pomphorhynchus laevis]